MLTVWQKARNINLVNSSILHNSIEEFTENQINENGVDFGLQ